MSQKSPTKTAAFHKRNEPLISKHETAFSPSSRCFNGATYDLPISQLLDMIHRSRTRSSSPAASPIKLILALVNHALTHLLEDALVPKITQITRAIDQLLNPTQTSAPLLPMSSPLFSFRRKRQAAAKKPLHISLLLAAGR